MVLHGTIINRQTSNTWFKCPCYAISKFLILFWRCPTVRLHASKVKKHFTLSHNIHCSITSFLTVSESFDNRFRLSTPLFKNLLCSDWSDGIVCCDWSIGNGSWKCMQRGFGFAAHFNISTTQTKLFQSSSSATL